MNGEKQYGDIAKELDAAVSEWALRDIRELSKRTLELAKFFFAVSAGTLGIIPFSERNFVSDSSCQILGMVLIGISALVAILLTDPPKFVVREKTDFHMEHRNYARRAMWLRYLWFVVWVLGVLFFLVSAHQSRG